MKRKNDRILDTVTLSSIFSLSEKIFVRLRKRDFISWALKSLQMVTAAMKLEDACSLEEKL